MTQENNNKDLCKTCQHYWQDPLPREYVVSHCDIVDEKYDFKGINDYVSYPCLKCPFNCYLKRNKVMTQEEKQLLLKDLCARLSYLYFDREIEMKLIEKLIKSYDE